ncbi:hypothetical protein [Acidithiobacillus thiooxidans]|jgi:hypothetical protein|uniref:hypothetical protein n=1 Tax=Acidithiobacillus thiooxidans TaxID=930 RepID=UPI0009DAB0CF|nr:hypothetical protein [Acidithiobacillus thiooxidans]
MNNVHPFPTGGQSANPIRKKRKRLTAYGPALLLPNIDGHAVDVLDHIIQAGSLYLSPIQEALEDSPGAQFLRTIHGMDALIDATNVLIYAAREHPKRRDQESIDELIQQAKATQKLIRKLDDMLPEDAFILSSDSFGPDLIAEYATNTAMLVVSRFAVGLLDYYDARFIQTKKDQRKTMMMDFRDAYRETIQDGRARMDAHNSLMKTLKTAQRALNKVMKEL